MPAPIKFHSQMMPLLINNILELRRYNMRLVDFGVMRARIPCFLGVTAEPDRWHSCFVRAEGKHLIIIQKTMEEIELEPDEGPTQIPTLPVGSTGFFSQSH